MAKGPILKEPGCKLLDTLGAKEIVSDHSGWGCDIVVQRVWEKGALQVSLRRKI